MTTNWRQILSWRNQEPQVGDRIRFLPSHGRDENRITAPSVWGLEGSIIDVWLKEYVITVKYKNIITTQVVFKEDWKDEFELI